MLQLAVLTAGFAARMQKHCAWCMEAMCRSWKLHEACMQHVHGMQHAPATRHACQVGRGAVHFAAMLIMQTNHAHAAAMLGNAAYFSYLS